MSDAGNGQPAPWFDAYEPEIKSFVAAKGLDKLDQGAALATALKSYFNTEKFVGAPAEKLLRLPDSHADPVFQTTYDRLTGMIPPPTADSYKFDGLQFKDGAALGDADAAFLRDFGVKHRLSPEAIRELGAGMIARADEDAGAVSNDKETRRAANQVALRNHWGGHYDQKAFAAKQVAENLGFSPRMFEDMADQPAEDYVKNMEKLAQLSQQLNEAAILRTGSVVRDPLAGMTPEQAQQEWDRLKADPEFCRRLNNRETEAVKMNQQLGSIIALGRIQQQSAMPQFGR